MTIGDLLPYLDNETDYFVINEQGLILTPYNDSGLCLVKKNELTPYTDLWVYNIAAHPIKVGVINIFVTKR